MQALRITTHPILHTSKRMHFIEDMLPVPEQTTVKGLHTSKRMHFIEEVFLLMKRKSNDTCIRQNVCTSLRT